MGIWAFVSRREWDGLSFVRVRMSAQGRINVLQFGLRIVVTSRGAVVGF